MSNDQDNITESAPAESAEAPTPAAGSAAAFSEFSLEQAKLALRKVKDPDLNLNIVDLGLVYDVRVDGNDVTVDMSLTSPPSRSPMTPAARSPCRACSVPTAR